MVESASPLPAWRSYQIMLGGLILAAWLILVAWAMTPYAVLLDHHEIEEQGFSALVRWPAFLAGWALMVVAMMLPGILLTLKPALRGAQQQAASGRVLGRFVLGYLVVWLAFGAGLYAGDTLLHGAVDAGLLPDSAEPLIPVVLLVLAGLYQFTPVKRICGEQGRFQAGSNRAEDSGLLRGGLGEGLRCIGTCGASMLVMFALGGGVNLVWMLALTLLAVLERTSRGARYVAWPLGIALLAWAVVLLAA